MNGQKNEGFTLIELIIVVAILAILVGILAPQYTKYVEKSRRSADMSNAKEIETTLRLALVTEDISIPIPTGSSDFVGLWVMICRNKDSAPKYYRDNGLNKGTVWCGADKDVVINGETHTGVMITDKSSAAIEKILNDAGISSKDLRTRSNGSSESWDWIVIQAGYNKSGQIFTKIYSGFKEENGSINQNHTSNIEKMMYGNN